MNNLLGPHTVRCVCYIIPDLWRLAFAREYDIERKWREARLYQTAPISTNLILAYIGQHVLGMPRSY